jgi:polyisoprenoid-binding protein YceI
MKIFLTAALSAAAFLAACSDPAANQPKATTSEPSNSRPANQSNSPAPGGDAVKGEGLSITPSNSTITFVGSKVTGKHQGGFTMFSGTVDLVNGKPEESSVTIEIDANTIFSDDAKLTDHLKSADFFDVAKFPKASFKSTRIEPGARPPDNYMVTGDLDLHGQTKSITFPAKIEVTDADVTVKAGFRINRKDFGMVYTGPADNLIRNDVSILLDVKTPRRK